MPKLLKAVIYCLKPRHPTLPLFPRCRWQVDESGNPTGVCVPFFESFMRRYEDSSVLEFNGQGTICCAEDSCSGLGLGPLFVFRESTIITGGTGRFVGVKGNGSDSGAEASDGIGIAQEEEVWVLPQAAETRP